MRINEEIKGKETRLIGPEGEQLGIFSIKEALRMAHERDLDLVEISPNAKPPVCRIMDFGKFKYEQSKREKETRKKQKVINVKEVKIRPNIEEHDLQVKTKNAIKFLKDGDKVKVTLMFRGREMAHAENAKQLMARVAELTKDFASVEKQAKVEGRNMIMILAPKQD